MGALDFLFEGKPPPSTTTYGTTTADMPKWLNDYTQGLISRANSIAAEPYQAYQGPRLAGPTADQENAYSMTRANSGSYLPGMQAAQGSVQGALTAAQPYLSQAGQNFGAPQVQQYMDPYVDNVINRAGTLAQRQLDEGFLPSVQKMFGANGASPRSTQMRATVDRGVRDLTEGLHEQALGALSQGYSQAGQLFNSDANRQGALAQTVGNLSINQGQVGGALAGQLQDMQTQDAAGLEAIGRTQQADTQRGLDLAHSDFEAQRDQPKSNVDWLSSVIRGTPTPRTTTTSSTGPGDTFQPSPLAQIGSLATGAAGLYDIFKKAKGGRVKRYARGGALRYAYGS